MKVIVTVLSLLLIGLPAFAGECVVSSTSGGHQKGSLAYLIEKSATEGACETEDFRYREKYKEIAGSIERMHVIRFDKSVTVYLEDRPFYISGTKNAPLIIAADDGRDVKISGKKLGRAHDGIVIKDGGGYVILDNLTFEDFPGPALTIKGDKSIVMNSKILRNGRRSSSPADGMIVYGNETKIINNEIAWNALNGIEISEGLTGSDCEALDDQSFSGGSFTVIMGNDIHDNGYNLSPEEIDSGYGAGIYIAGHQTRIEPWVLDTGLKDLSVFYGDVETDDNGGVLVRNRIHNNLGAGVYVETNSIALACLDGKRPPDWHYALHTAFITGSNFGNNGGKGIMVSEYPLPRPVDIVSVGAKTSDEYVIVGNVGKGASEGYPWNENVLNFEMLRVELFSAASFEDGEGVKYLTSTEKIEPESRRFVIRIPKAGLKEPVFVATTVDMENLNTSPFSLPLAAEMEDDFDGDGLKNWEEDINHDGIVDVLNGETDPRLKDTDGDGLTDGEERLLNGHLSDMVARGLKLLDPKRLDPTNFDSDGDCLPDGLELGVNKEKIKALLKRDDESMLGRPLITLSPECRSNLKGRGILSIENSIPFNEGDGPSLANIAGIYDTDPETTTDPTNPDSDGDGLRDGAEDYNLNGKRDEEEGGSWKETDPLNPDSDGDGLRDGEEGDKNGNGMLDPQEMNPLKNDTDGDGVTDDFELRLGSLPNSCDTDGDLLPDGIEAIVIHPTSERPECVGLQAAGTNYTNPGILNTVVEDSDGDGLGDGHEDNNCNGWVDIGETDPSNPDTDGDGIPDGVEETGDIDLDGVPDFDIAHINNGADCNPPLSISDADCDALPNAVDTDSDNDGCLDADEGVIKDGDKDGVPDVYDADTKGCGGGGGVSSQPSFGAGGPPPAGGGGNEEGIEAPVRYTTAKGGGACSLLIKNECSSIALLFSFISILLVQISRISYHAQVKRRGRHLCSMK